MATRITKIANGQSQTVDLWSAATANVAGTELGTTFIGFQEWDTLTLYIECQGITGGALDVYVQNSADGVKFYDYFRAAFAAGGAARKRKWSPVLDGVIYTIGSGTEASPGVALSAAAGSEVGAGGPWFDYLRVVMVSGAGASAGAAQIVR